MLSRSRNIALFSMVAVIAGGWLTFRAQSPNSKDILISNEDRKMMVGGDVAQPTSGRAPSGERSQRS